MLEALSFLTIKMVLHDLIHVFNTLDVDCKGFIEWDTVQEFDEALYFDALDIDQIEAAIDMVMCFVYLGS